MALSRGRVQPENIQTCVLKHMGCCRRERLVQEDADGGRMLPLSVREGRIRL